jgi:Fe-Mn family superoxide dismutase
VLDAWEHAYYLQYKNVKAAFFEAVWNVWNWEDIAARFEVARTVRIGQNGGGRREVGSGRGAEPVKAPGPMKPS